MVDLYYFPQDIAYFMFEIDLGAKSQEPFVRAVWSKEFSYIAPEWRKNGYKGFYKAVLRYLDGCVDVDDKKKDIAFWNAAGKDNPNINYTEADYINDPAKLNYYFFKSMRLKLLFFNKKESSVCQSKKILDVYSDLNELEKYLTFYHLEYHFYGYGGKTTAPLSKLKKSTNFLYFTLTDGVGIYGDFRDEVADDEDVDDEPTLPEMDMYINILDLVHFFKMMDIKQKGKNNQFQFVQTMVADYLRYLWISESYNLAYLIYDRVKETKNSTPMPKFALLKYIKLYTIRTGCRYECKVNDLYNDAALSGTERPLSVLKSYLESYGLVCFVDDNKADISKLTLFQKVSIGGANDCSASANRP